MPRLAQRRVILLFLADARLVLEPNLYAFDAEPRFVRDFIQARAGSFF